jgi:hypothetical protein
LERFQYANGGPTGHVEVVNNIADNAVFLLAVAFTKLAHSNGFEECHSVLTTREPTLALPRVVPGGAASDFLYNRLSEIVGQSSFIHKSGSKLPTRRSISDAPWANRVVEVFFAIHRARINIAPCFAATLAWLLRLNDAAALDWITMVFENRQVHKSPFALAFLTSALKGEIDARFRSKKMVTVVIDFRPFFRP